MGDPERRGDSISPRAPYVPPVRKEAGDEIVEMPQGTYPGGAYNVGESGWAAA